MVLGPSPNRKAQIWIVPTGGPSPNPVPGMVEYYILSLKVEEKSPRTLEAYLERLMPFAQMFDKPVELVTPHDVRTFIGGLMDRKLASSTVNAYYRALHSFFEWLVKEGILQISPMVAIKPPKIPSKVVKPLSADNIKNVLLLLSKQRQNFLNFRNRAMFLMFLDTGLRLREMAEITLDHVDIEQGVVLVMGKGAKERRVRLGRVTHQALLRYWLLRRDYPGSGLWLTEEHLPLGRDGIRTSVKRLLKDAGVSGVKMGPHTIRHTFAINAFRNGAREFEVQQILGHSTLTMTRKYMSSLSSEQVMKSHEKFSPVDNLK